MGRRLTKLGDVTFHYLWNGNVPLHEWQTGNRYVGSVLTPYSEDFKTWLFEEESFVPLALIQDGKAYSIVCDQLGTPTEAYDEEGKEVWYRRLDMNGKILEETQPGLNPEGYVSIPFLFQGQYYDYETGLAYNRFRYYDPELGRYISQDPIGLAGGIKLYGYVKDSLSWIDPFGLTSTSYAEEARALGYESVNNQRSHGQPIFKKGRSKGEKQKSPKGSPRYITPDKDQHIGGYWKGAERIEDLHSKRTRSGTYDKNLNRIGD